VHAAPHNKSLQRSGGRCPLVCSSLAVLDKVPTLGRREPPAAELSRWATLLHAPVHQDLCNQQIATHSKAFAPIGAS
jgi:hypothetical protein